MSESIIASGSVVESLKYASVIVSRVSSTSFPNAIISPTGQPTRHLLTDRPKRGLVNGGRGSILMSNVKPIRTVPPGCLRG